MRNFKLTIEYDGTDFHGWQAQINAPRTVQGELEKVLSRIFKQSRVVVIGSGRTDKGVHARGQTAHCHVETVMPADELQRALNFNLPRDIVIHDVADVPLEFHAQMSARSKIYSYSILNRPFSSALERRSVHFFPRRLDVRLMAQEARCLLGEHDFCSFANVDPSHKGGTIRNIMRLDLEHHQEKLVVTIEADGFLYKMVRNIVGTLLEVGTGRFPAGSVHSILELRDRSAAGTAVVSCGLCLEKVCY